MLQTMGPASPAHREKRQGHEATQRRHKTSSETGQSRPQKTDLLSGEGFESQASKTALEVAAGF